MYGDTGTSIGNFVTLDANGQAHIRFGSPNYKINVLDSTGAQVPGWPVDNIQGYPALLTVASQAAVQCTAGQAQLFTSTIIPALVQVFVVTTYVSGATSIGISQGLNGFAIGDATVIDRWGVQANLSIGALSGGTDASSGAQARLTELMMYPNPQRVILTALGGTFDGTGTIDVAVQYLATPHRMS
jgi:hypothetical protein